MMSREINQDYVKLTEDEKRMAKASSATLHELLLSERSLPETSLTLHGKSGKTEKLMEVPPAIYRLLARMFSELGKGNAVTLIPIHAQLTTQEAADFLNVSRPFLVARLEAGEIPFHRVGTHRRVRFEDVVRYKDHIDQQRHKALEKLGELDQELGLGYSR